VAAQAAGADEVLVGCQLLGGFQAFANT
jgi:hypothetical protein